MNNSLVFQIDSMINITKNSETKIYKSVQELTSLAKQNDGKDRSSDTQEMTEESQFIDRK